MATYCAVCGWQAPGDTLGCLFPHSRETGHNDWTTSSGLTYTLDPSLESMMVQVEKEPHAC